ncbi:MAG TPA: hypothetical protein VFO85_13290, partial [Vicinamibacteria bacterium]|nr:hypothetical protein [Vicinamibacteria bacterium]
MGVHDNVAALEAFLEHLGQAEHVLETAAEQLDEESHRIGERKSDLEDWIKAVREDVRELREKTAETALRAPVGQADRLKENARLTDQSADLVASGASAFEGELHATASEAVKTVERVDALEAQRFTPLAALLEEQQAAFTTFVEATGAPLDDLLEALQEATERQDGVESEAVGALKEAEQSCVRDHQLA